MREIDEAVVRKWMYEYPHVTEVHIWGRFPCVDLSAVKYMRKNLRGSQSSLLHELILAIKLVRQVFGFKTRVLCFVGNVASMDKSARQEISGLLGVNQSSVIRRCAHFQTSVLLDQLRCSRVGRSSNHR